MVVRTNEAAAVVRLVSLIVVKARQYWVLQAFECGVQEDEAVCADRLQMRRRVRPKYELEIVIIALHKYDTVHHHNVLELASKTSSYSPNIFLHNRYQETLPPKASLLLRELAQSAGVVVEYFGA